jgi:hypothetical protein
VLDDQHSRFNVVSHNPRPLTTVQQPHTSAQEGCEGVPGRRRGSQHCLSQPPHPPNPCCTCIAAPPAPPCGGEFYIEFLTFETRGYGQHEPSNQIHTDHAQMLRIANRISIFLPASFSSDQGERERRGSNRTLHEAQVVHHQQQREQHRAPAHDGHLVEHHRGRRSEERRVGEEGLQKTTA